MKTQIENWLEKPWLMPSVLFLLALIVYFPTLQNGFIIDDDSIILNNWQMQSLVGLQKIWGSTQNFDYWPLSYTSFWVEHQLWGNSPLPYHLVNLFLHAINACLLFWILKKLKIRAAWLIAILFSIHPVQAETVAWIIELKSLQSALFFFLSIWAYLRFEESRAQKYYWAALLLFVAALLSKSSIVMLPVVFLILLGWKNGALKTQDWLRQVPFFVVALLSGILTIWFQTNRAGASELSRDPSLFEQAKQAGAAVWFYLGKIIWPVPVSFNYPAINTDSLFGLIGLVAVIAALVFSWRKQKTWAQASLPAFLFFLAMLFPVLGFFDVYYFTFSPVADRWQYLAMIGPVILLAALIERFFYLAAIPIVFVLGVLSWQHNQNFKNEEALWEDTLQKNPNSWMAKNGLGCWVAKQGKVDEGIQLCREAFELSPTFFVARNNVAVLLQAAHKNEEAEKEWRAILESKPDFAAANFNLGECMLAQGKLDQAIEYYQRAAQKSPHRAAYHYQLGRALFLKGRANESALEIQEAFRLNPTFR